MSATTTHLTNKAPALRPAAVTGRCLVLPQTDSERVLEGGLRTRGVFKSSLPGLPLVTVVTVSRNVESTLAQAIESVLAQSYPNIEYIIVDGASDDGTAGVIQQFAEQLDYFVSEPDRGIYHAMNKGLGLASGELVLLLNADDWYHGECVELLVEARWTCGASVSAALAQYVDADGNPTRIMRHMPFDAGTRLRMPLRHEAMLVPARVYDEVGGYDERYRIIADLEFTARLHDAGHRVIEVPRPLLYFRETGVSNAHKDRLFNERAALMQDRFPFLGATDAQWFAELPTLTPERMDDLYRRYGQHGDFCAALFDYARDRQGLRAQAPWREATGPFFAALRALPAVSVVLPLFNAEQTLGDCLDSILAQRFADLEVICIDDCSPDGARRIAEDYARRDARIRVLSNPRNLGLGATRNRGISAARGRYVFHIDPDDTMPPDALDVLYAAATRHGSDLVKGSYLRGQFVHGQPAGDPRTITPRVAAGLTGATLAQAPDLLRTTEGHWSFLYRIDLARRVPYPNDLKMGQDSLFLVNALLRATSISVIGDVVYHYNANPASAMNTFTMRKYLDALEWRSRAFRILRRSGFEELGRYLLVDYWGPAFFAGMETVLSTEEIGRFNAALRAALLEAGIRRIEDPESSPVRQILAAVLPGDSGNPGAADGAVRAPATAADRGNPAPASPPLRIATWSSFDHGGAGTGTQRRVASLRAHGVDAQIFSLVVRSDHDYVHRLTPPGQEPESQDQLWQRVRQHAIETMTGLDGYRARELFSAPYAAVRLPEVASRFHDFDVIHLHWVVGMLDLENLGQCWADKPIVWTLADMNAFTGGCHYSEGCDGYKRECHDCPLLGAHGDLAHQAWLAKKRAYDALTNLQIICPSRWLAQRASESSLFRDRAVHYVPNAFPTDEFEPTNRIVARRRLGLPLDKKLLIFGADSLRNKRKGGDLLRSSLETLAARNQHHDIELILFGNDRLDLPVRSHSLGFVNDSRRLSLAYSAADAYLFPSREDNAPLTVGEALLCGTPVVAYAVGHVPDLVRHGETGYIADYCDPQDFAEGILSVLKMVESDPLHVASQAHASAVAFHSPETSVARHLDIYHKALTTGAPDAADDPVTRDGGSRAS